MGIQWPYRRILMLETYYLYQHTSKDPKDTNVFGITLNLYLRNEL